MILDTDDVVSSKNKDIILKENETFVLCNMTHLTKYKDNSLLCSSHAVV